MFLLLFQIVMVPLDLRETARGGQTVRDQELHQEKSGESCATSVTMITVSSKIRVAA